MTQTIIALGFAVGLALTAPAANAACTDPDLNAVRDEVLAACPCTGNHGQYVSCVNREVREAVREGRLDVNCKGKVTRCAARSTCGKKSGFVTCTLCEPGACVEGLCADGVTACSETTPCPLEVRRCTTKSDAALCELRGGIVGDGSCCQASCSEQ
jgi:hypothetical protein